jgi:3-hydroxymyristoyl/3-hydroxydecanoyl-(acyl carrier protein) dehydratase
MGVCAIDAMQGRQHHLVEVHGARFRQPVVPGDLIELTVVSAGDAGSMQFELRRADTIVSRGLLVLEG